MDNIPAFPSGDFRSVQPHDGMTLRDYFAAKAMQGIVSAYRGGSSDSWSVILHDTARAAYEYADAMLERRAATHPSLGAETREPTP